LSFKVTGTAINFGDNITVIVSGSIAFVDSIDTTGGGGGGTDLLIYDNSVFKVTGTALDFGDNLDVVITGSIAYITAVGVTGSVGPQGPPGAEGATGSAGPQGLQGIQGDNTLLIYDDHVFKVTGTAIDFTDNINVIISGSIAYISSVDTVGGGGGGTDLIIYDDSVFKVTGTAISFDTSLSVAVTGSVAFISSTATGGAVATDAIWDAAGDLVQGTGADTAAHLHIGTANQLLRVNSGATAVEWAGVGRVLVSQQTPTATGTVSWNNIPATYNSLEIEYVGRSTDNGGALDLSIRCNNDTTATNYRRMIFESFGGNSNAASGGDDYIIARISGDQVGNSASSGYIKIINYASTTFNKDILTRYATRDDVSSTHVRNGSSLCEWESTAAITRIDLVLSAGNYDTGSTFRLYLVN
jgi:hypothetical protein